MTLGNFSFGPLLHNTLGFDEAFKELDRMLTSSKPTSTFPPHNIFKKDNQYIVELATAGFSKDELDVSVHDGYLIITGLKKDQDDKIDYIHKGIGTRSFTKKMKLINTIKVIDAEYVDGILRVVLENEIPEEKKPIKIEIGGVSNKQLLTE